MALMRNLAKLGLAKKVIDEARKPENQQKVKNMIASAKAKRSAQKRHPR